MLKKWWLTPNEEDFLSPKDKFQNFIWRNGKRQIKFFFQRRKRGFDDSELWSLDNTIMNMVLPRLKAFRNLPPAGFPVDMYTPEEMEAADRGEELEGMTDRAYQRWLDTLDKMIRGIELYLKDDMFFKRDEEGNVVYEGDHEGIGFKLLGRKGLPVHDEELEKEFKEGWELFQKYFFALWD